MDIRFYKCARCGNVALKAFDSGAPLSCCGDAMEELEANTVDAAVEKHVPALSVGGSADGAKLHVEVGEVAHPMLDEHFIAFVCLVGEKSYQIASLQAGDTPVADFSLVEGDAAVKVYAYCNLHGLWSAEV